MIRFHATVQSMTPLYRKIMKYLRDYPLLSYRTIADYANCSNSYVREIAFKHNMQRKQGIVIPVEELEEGLLDYERRYENKVAEASDIFTCAERLDELASDGSDEVRVAVANNYTDQLMQSTIDRLAYDPNENVCASVASRVSYQVLQDWIYNKLHSLPLSVRQGIPYNSNCDEDMYNQLMQDEDYQVVALVARYMPHPSLQTCGHLVNHPEPAVRIGLARNTATTEELVLILVNDENSQVKSYALSHTNFPRKEDVRLLKSDNPNDREILATHTDDPDILDELAHDPNIYVLMAVAGNTSCSKAAKLKILQLADTLQKEWRVELKSTIAENDETTVELLDLIYQSEDSPEIDAAIAYNWCAANTDNLLHRIAVESTDQGVLITVLDNPNVASRTAVVLSKHPSKQVRQAAIKVLQERARQPQGYRFDPIDHLDNVDRSFPAE